MSLKDYSVPQQSKVVLLEGIVSNSLISKDLPEEVAEYVTKVHFEGSDGPMIPINWRFAESVSSLKGLEAVMLMNLLDRKYNVKVDEVRINTLV